MTAGPGDAYDPFNPEDVPDRLLALAAQFRAPAALGEQGLQKRFGPRSSWSLDPGQVWRALHGHVSALVLVLDISTERITAVPLSFERDNFADDIVPVKGSSVSVQLYAWPTLARELPLNVLDRPVDVLSDALTQTISQASRRASHQAEHQPASMTQTPPRHRTTGLPGESSDSPSDLAPGQAADLLLSDLRAELEDDLSVLADVPLIPVLPVGDQDAAGQPGEQPVVAAVIDPAALDPELLLQAGDQLGVSFPVLLEMIDGKRPTDLAQQQVLREILGAAPASDAKIPTGLLTALAHPRWRSLIRHHQEQLTGPGLRPSDSTSSSATPRSSGATGSAGMTASTAAENAPAKHPSESEARASVAAEIYTLAARQSGTADPYWIGRIEQWASAHHIDLDAET